MNTKEYLRQYRTLCGKIERFNERIEQIEASLQRSVNIDGLPHGTGTSDPTQQTAIKLADIRAQLKRATMEAELTRQTIATEIESVEDPIYRELLYSRYILRLNWEDVTDRISRGRRNRYDSKHVMSYMHRNSLKAFEKVRNASA